LLVVSSWGCFDSLLGSQTVTDYTSESGYYQGKVKNYTMHLSNPANFWFWYITDMDDRPIEQGEGACAMMPRGCGGPPHYLFHQYDPKTFKPFEISPATFEVPVICKASTVGGCLVEPTQFCVP